MSSDERIHWMLRAAARAEREGHERVARALRRMADETRPVGVAGPGSPSGATTA